MLRKNHTHTYTHDMKVRKLFGYIHIHHSPSFFLSFSPSYLVHLLEKNATCTAFWEASRFTREGKAAAVAKEIEHKGKWSASSSTDRAIFQEVQ